MASAAENRRGILFMLLAMSFYIVNDAFMKLAREVYPAGQAITLRTGFAVVIGIALVFAARQGDRLSAALNPRVLLRGLLEALSALAFGWTLGLMPLANLTAINMASPLLIVALAVLLRIERVGWRRVLALTVGFIGVLFVVRPGAEAFNAASIVAVFCAFLTAARDLSTRFISNDIPSTVVSLTTTVLTGIVAIAFGLTEEWQPIWRLESVYVACAAVLVVIGTFFIIGAFRRTDISVVSLYRYSIIVFATLLGYLVWGDVPDLFTTIGVALIVGSGLYTMHRQRVRPDSNLKLSRKPAP
ncbi:DMT family transporter [Bosea sp. (in: a-proteobacteria)]|uniref:DMT family transporter n=1 Tax=Bosea sp. (in: a-proteobacteria) TaxID=1871050 RepID=UPI00261CBFE6|nr:DMT family transporter [Bosea sp. (in: a-proteobacteria)]MCO5092604.1 DMT family transporter [Bosea sp. (in: a-proteobacteria)]